VFDAEVAKGLRDGPQERPMRHPDHESGLWKGRDELLGNAQYRPASYLPSQRKKRVKLWQIVFDARGGESTLRERNFCLLKRLRRGDSECSQGVERGVSGLRWGSFAAEKQCSTASRRRYERGCGADVGGAELSIEAAGYGNGWRSGRSLHLSG